jgi:hypothetical protein
MAPNHNSGNNQTLTMVSGNYQHQYPKSSCISMRFSPIVLISLHTPCCHCLFRALLNILLVSIIIIIVIVIVVKIELNWISLCHHNNHQGPLDHWYWVEFVLEVVIEFVTLMVLESKLGCWYTHNLVCDMCDDKNLNATEQIKWRDMILCYHGFYSALFYFHRKMNKAKS